MQEVKMELSAASDASNLTLSDLKQLILKTPIKEWTKSHGQSVLTYLENGEAKTELSFSAGCNGEGFLVQHSNQNDINDILFAVEGEHTNKILEYTFGGDVYETFAEYLVSKETLIAAAEYFMQNGQRSPKLEWQDFIVPELIEAQAA